MKIQLKIQKNGHKKAPIKNAPQNILGILDLGQQFDNGGVSKNWFNKAGLAVCEDVAVLGMRTIVLLTAAVIYSTEAFMSSPSDRHRRTTTRAASPIDDTLTLEGLAQLLVDMEARLAAEAPELSVGRRREKLLRQRIHGLKLNRARVSPSVISGAGHGVVATRDIAAGELITLYPCDALLVARTSSTKAPSVFFGSGVPSEERSPPGCFLSAPNALDYQLQVPGGGGYSIVGDPSRRSDPAYLGHMVNDAEGGSGAERSSLSKNKNKVQNNAESIMIECVVEAARRDGKTEEVPLRGFAYSIAATRDIDEGREVFMSYGGKYWNLR